MYNQTDECAGDEPTPGQEADAIMPLNLLPGSDRPLPKELLMQLRHRDDVYLGYYESGEGHPLVFVRSRFSERAWLYHGGKAWRRFTVSEGVVRQGVLTKAERAWVATCWLASSRRRNRRSMPGGGAQRRVG